jgi:WD40 repeat protein/serine/threonine protein kinase
MRGAVQLGGLHDAKAVGYGRAVLFRVLGPLEVSVEHRQIPLGGPKQRSVLANLLVRRNQVVPAEDLIDQVWGDEPPDTARKTLQSYVTRLRKALGRERLEWRAPGYILHLDSGELDAARFELLLREAKAAAERPDTASALYRRALELWRGSAFADLGEDGLLPAEAMRLEELRMQAVEGMVAADLDAGRQADVVAQLESLIREEPLREGFWGQLMLALYRCGRQADALAAYQRARNVLADELGVDPADKLQRLHEQILRHDPALEAVHDGLRGYELIEEIGQGSIGVVHRGRQPHLDRDVAIKVIRSELADEPEFIRWFEAEAQLVARLEHPNIVPLYDYWREPVGAYLVMRWIRGGSLDDVLRSRALDLETVARLEQDLARALSFAHDLGVVHGDIKPTNVLLDEDGNAYLSDFAIATHLPGIQANRRHVRPTPAYLSPEQIRNERSTRRTDLYSLGLLVHQALCGGRLISETPRVVLLQKQPQEPLPPVTERRPDLSSAVDAVIARATAEDPADRFADAAEFDLAFREALHTDRASAVRVGGDLKPNNPYKGLRPFSEADAVDFFGRDVLVDHLLARLDESVEGHRFVGLVGPSGCGKSSAVRAGLVPALRSGAKAGSDTWFFVDMMPGPYPFEELEASLLRIATNPPATLIDLFMGQAGLVDAVERVLPPDGSELFLVIDQLEELFTHVDDEETRARFLASIASAALDPRSRVRVLVTLRADYYDRPLVYPGFGPLLASRTETVTPLTPAELELAVALPAARVGVKLEPTLVAEIVADASAGLGALPLLQYALTELFERRQNGTLTLSGYREVGGVGGALAGRAEHLYATRGTEAGKEATRQLLLRLVNIDESVEDLRRRVRRTQLESLEGDRDAMRAAIDAFTRHRLLTADRDRATREPTVEVAHEALLRCWPRLRGWIDSAREDLRSHRRLATEAAEWERSGRDTSFVLRGSRLSQFEAWSESTGIALSSAEREYLKASVIEREIERAAEKTRRERERFLERRSAKRLRALVAVLTVAALVASSLALIAMDRGRRAEQEATIARARELAAAAVANLDVDPERSILLAMQAVEATRSVDGSVLPEAEEALHRAVTTSRLVRSLPGGRALDWSATGVYVAVDADNTGRLDIRSPENGKSILSIVGPPAHINDVAFSQDGSLLAAASDDGQITVWDTKHGNLVASMTGAEPSSDPTFSRDGSLVIGAWPQSGMVKILDVATGTVIRTLRHLPGASHTAINRRATTIVVGTEGEVPCIGPTVVRIDLRTGQRFPFPHFDPCGSSFVTWSPDGRYIAAAGNGCKLTIWFAATGKVQSTPLGHTDCVVAADWSSDSRRLVTGSYDGTARVWEITSSGAQQRVVLPTEGNGVVSDVAFSPDQTRVITTTGRTEVARIWDVSTSGGAEWAIFPPRGPGQQESVGTRNPRTPVGFAAFIADGHVIVQDRTPRLAIWDVQKKRKVGTIGPSPAAGDEWAFEPPRFDVTSDGATVAISRGYGGIVWDSATEKELYSFGRPDFDLSPSGDFLALHTGSSGGVRIFDRSGHEVAFLIAPDGLGVGGIQLSPDGSRIAIAAGKQVMIVDWEEGPRDVSGLPVGARVSTIHTQSEELAFNSSGRLLATAGDDRRPEVWDVETAELRVTFPTQPGDIYGMAFSPDGSRLATGSADGTVRLLDARSGQLLFTLPSDGHPVSRVSFSPDGSMLAVSTTDGSARIWALDIDDLLQIAQQKLTRSLTGEECWRFLHVDACPDPTA